MTPFSQIAAVIGVLSPLSLLAQPSCPAVLSQPPSQVATVAGREIRLRCEILEVPAITYRWSIGNLALADSERISGTRTHTLTIRQASIADQGSYRLAVTAPCGSVDVWTYVSVYEQPTPWSMIDLSSVFTNRWNTDLRHAGFNFPVPEGRVDLGGTPFFVPEQARNTWFAGIAAGAGNDLVCMVIQPDLYGVGEVRVLLTLNGGVPDATLANIEFFGSRGAYCRKHILTGVDARSWIQDSHPDTISGTTSNVVRVVRGSSEYRLDMASITLPLPFRSQRLAAIRVNDSGSSTTQRLLIYGMTARLDPSGPCRADANDDGFVNPDDLSDFITCFFLDVQFPTACPEADFNSDGFRDPDDLSDFITQFFLGC